MAYHATYSANGVTVNFAGFNLTGKADGEFLTIARTGDRTEIRSGADGHKSIALLADHSATVTYTCFPESDTAKVLTALDQVWRTAESMGNGVAGALPLNIVDRSGAVLLTSISAVMQRTGDISLGTNSGTVEFTFYVDNPVFAPLPSGLASKVEKLMDKLPKVPKLG